MNLGLERHQAKNESNGVPLTSAEERHRLLVEWNRTDLDFDRSRCIHHLIEKQVGRTPEQTAIISSDRTLTYRQLNERAERLAGFLISLGAGPDKIVGVSLKRSVDLVVALFAVLKAGGAYLPLDPSFPSERIDFMLSDSQAAIVITQTSFADRFEGRVAHIIAVDVFCEEGNLPLGVSATVPINLAYLIYTSGSTGTPKGVMVEHRNVVSFFAAMDQLLGHEPGVWLAVTSISFDISVLELLWTLTRGFTVILQTDDNKLLFSGKYSLLEQLRGRRVTHLQCTPTLAKMLIVSPGASAMKGLRVVLIGGEALLPSLASKLRATLNADIYNMYGPTETTIWSMSYSLRGEEKPIPIGRPIANTQVYILDHNLQPVAIGVEGELYIGGSGVARGYWRKPELTAERFLQDPFRLGGQNTIYKTGDFARYRPDGMVEFLGRADHQVKIRGFRVELGEVETVLSRHPGVRDAVVGLGRTNGGDPQLVTYVVPLEHLSVDEKILRIYLRQKLPDYMVPSRVVFMMVLPTTPNGKVDRNALPLAQPTMSGAMRTTKTRTDLEAIISRIWMDILGVDKIGSHDSFFDLGANSLAIAEAASSLSLAVERPVALVDFFTYPTVHLLADFLSGSLEPAAILDGVAERATARRESVLRRARTDRMRNGRTEE